MPNVKTNQIPELARGGDLTQTRLLCPGGHVAVYDNPALAYAVWLGLPKGVRCAFRSAGDPTLVYPHDYVDRS